MPTLTEVDELCETVARAATVGAVGSRTHWEVGGPAPTGDDVTLVHAPAGIVAYDPADLTVTLAAGTRSDELAAVLAAEGQESVLDPRDGASTVGGLLATGLSGHRRLRHGPLRDRVLEVRFVTADGRLVKGGGPTVKNVSGFDLPRLLVGSLGSRRGARAGHPAVPTPARERRVVRHRRRPLRAATRAVPALVPTVGRPPHPRAARGDSGRRRHRAGAGRRRRGRHRTRAARWPPSRSHLGEAVGAARARAPRSTRSARGGPRRSASAPCTWRPTTRPPWPVPAPRQSPPVAGCCARPAHPVSTASAARCRTRS